MTLSQDKDRSGDISFDSDQAWEAYGSNKAKLNNGQNTKDRESHRLGGTKKESRQPHRLGSTKDGFGETTVSSFALDEEAGFGHDWKSFTEDRGWSEMDLQQAKAWKTAQSERNATRGDGRRISASRPNSSSSSLDFDDIHEEQQPQQPQQPPLKVNPSIGVKRPERVASTRMVPKVKVNLAKQSSSATGFSLDNSTDGLETVGRRAPQRTKSMDVDMFGTGDLGFGFDASTNGQSSKSNLSQSFRLGAPNEAPPGRSRRRASLAINSQPQIPNDTPGELMRVRSRRRASLAVGAAPPPSVQDLQPEHGPSEGMRMRSRRRASLAINAAPDNATSFQNLQLDTTNETPRVRTRRRASMAANDGNFDVRRGVQRAKSMDVEMLGSGDGGQGSFRNVRRINSTDSQEISFRNANRLGNNSASVIADESDIPLPPPASRSPRIGKNDESNTESESADRKNKMSPRSRRRLNMRRINSVDSSCSSNGKHIQKAMENDSKRSESPPATKRTEQGHRRRGVQRVHSNGLQDLISGLQSKKKADLEAELIAEENETSESEHLHTHEDQERTVQGQPESVSNDPSTTSSTSPIDGDHPKTIRSSRIQKLPGANQSRKEKTSGDTASSKLNGHVGNSSFNSSKSGESELNMSERSRSTSSRFSRQHAEGRSGSGSALDRERTPNSSLRKRRDTPKRGVDRSKSSDDSMAFGAWTSGDSSVKSRKKITKSPSRRKSVAAGECQRSGLDSKESQKELVDNGGIPSHDKGFIASFLGSPELATQPHS